MATSQLVNRDVCMTDTEMTQGGMVGGGYIVLVRGDKAVGGGGTRGKE